MTRWIDRLPDPVRWVLFLPVTYIAHLAIMAISGIILFYATIPLLSLIKTTPTSRLVYAYTITCLATSTTAFICTYIYLKIIPKYQKICLILFNLIYVAWTLHFGMGLVYLLSVACFVPISFLTGYFVLKRRS